MMRPYRKAIGSLSTSQHGRQGHNSRAKIYSSVELDHRKEDLPWHGEEVMCDTAYNGRFSCLCSQVIMCQEEVVIVFLPDFLLLQSVGFSILDIAARP